MKSIFLIVFILVNFVAGSVSFAQKVSKQGKDIIITAKSCSTIERELPALEEWTNSTGKYCDASKIKLSRTSPCRAVITSCVPEHVVTYQEYETDVNSPNCWNLALVMGNLIPYLRFTSEGEMTHFTQEPFCRKLNPGEKRRPGDMGAIRVPNREEEAGFSEIHGFIYVSDRLVYSKNGPMKHNPFKLQRKSEVFGLPEYRMVGAPAKCSGNVAPSMNNCRGYTEYFRCTNMEEFLVTKAPLISERVKKMYSTLNEVDCNVSQVEMTSQMLTPSFLKNLNDITTVLSTYVKEQVKDVENLSHEDKVVLSAIKGRLGGLWNNIDGEFMGKLEDERAQRWDLNDIRILFKYTKDDLEEAGF